MFRDLKEYQEIQNLYANNVYFSEEEKQFIEVIKEAELTDEELQYLSENTEEIINFIQNNRKIKFMYIVHSDRNAIFNAAENGVSLRDATIYTVGLPVCHDCAKGLIQVGIKRVVTPEIETPERWLESLALTEQMFEEAGIVWNKIRY